MAADALVPCITWTSVATKLTVWGKQILVFEKEAFKLLVPTHFWEVVENTNIFFF